MQITPDSHLDHHLQQSHVALIRERFGDRTEFFLETIELPKELPSLSCQLHGPAVGEPPVAEDEVRYEIRGKRKGPSRLCSRPPAEVRTMTVIGGLNEGQCILFTAYGGPSAPREPWDDDMLTDEDRATSRRFWAEHALGGE